jgi:4-diphosphocytidyl-2-C-methyl-D-erythritol kinase
VNSPDETITVRAPAKLTRSLRVVGRRDDGYHLIDAEMVTLDLLDTLTITPADDIAVTVGGPFAAGVPTDRTNLVWRALELAQRGARVHLDKQIPSGGGLGGGSTDAAAILRWAGITAPQDTVRIGADVPFCVSGGRARVTGIGEVIEPLEHQDETYTLCIPPFGVSTAAVYRIYDEIGAHIHARWSGNNDLEGAATIAEPALANYRNRFAELTGCGPILAGSGSTMFVEGDHGSVGAALPDATVLVVRTAGGRPGGPTR